MTPSGSPALRRPSYNRVSLKDVRIDGHIGETRVVRLKRRDRPELCAGRQGKELLQRFTGLRFMTG